MALPFGGLGPLPALNSTVFSLSDMGITATGAADICALTNSFQNSDDELVIGVTDNFTGTNQRTTFYSWQAVPHILNQIQQATYGFTTGRHNFCAFPFTTTIFFSGAFQPVVVLALAAPDGPTDALLVYPQLAAPGTFTTSTIANTAGTSFGHQNRIVIQQAFGYAWPFTPTIFPNEAFSYTDPPGSDTWPHQFELFGPENPFGYGAVNSMSAGELFCVKNRGGAVIIQGDLNNPTVTTLPGVKSTGGIYGHSATGVNGMYYCAERHGAWVWNGGNTSRKVSAQLDDNFFLPYQTILSPFYGYYAQRWGEWILFSNNWVLNEATGGWWRMSDPANYSWYWAVPGYSETVMYVCLASATGVSEPILSSYNRATPAKFYTWQSLPIHLRSADRTADVRSISVRASNPYADSNPTVTVTLLNSDGSSDTLGTQRVPSTNDQPVLIRFNASVHSEFVAVNLNCTGTVAPPIIHTLGVGYRTREHAGLAN
jgi:hypothetical protein